MDSDGAAPWHPAARLGNVGSKDFLGMESYWPFFQSQLEGIVVFFSISFVKSCFRIRFASFGSQSIQASLEVGTLRPPQNSNLGFHSRLSIF